jgi:hypothetical protein
MLKEIPKSDVIVRPVKVYKEFSLTEEDIVPVFGKNITGSLFDEDTDEQSNGIYKRLLYRSIKEQFYRNSATASILTEVGRRISYASTDERNLEDEIGVIAIPQQKYGEGVKVGSVRLVDNIDVEIPYVEFEEDFSAGSGSWDFSTGSMKISSVADGGLESDSYYLTNSGSATLGVLSISSSLAYGTWEFDWWQNSVGSNSLRIYYISGTSNPLGIAAASSTYHMFWNIGASAFAQQRNGSDVATPTENFRSSGFTSGGNWYRIKVVREAGGLTNVYAKGGGFGSNFVLLTATSGANPFTDNIITTSKFFSIVLRGDSAITNIIAYDQNNTSTIQVENEYVDDTYSNLVSGSGDICGNIFYDRGLVVLTKGVVSGSTLSDFRLDYRSTNTIYENEVFLTVLENEFNVSQNPTAVDDGRYIKFNTFTSSLDSDIHGGFADYDASSSIDPTGSYLAPYITTIGLYDNDNQMVAVAKLPRPIKSLPDYPVNFIIRFDT